MTEFEFKTKYFGNITINVDSDGFGDSDVMYEGKEINIFFSDYNSYGDKVKTCLAMLDKYVELNAIAKKAIAENISKDDTVSYYFECHFDILDKESLATIFGVDDFEKMDVKRTIEQLPYPNLLFSLNDNKIEVSVDYKVAEEYSDEILCVKMDENLLVKGFSHES